MLLIKCYIELKRYNDAEKLLKKRIKKTKNPILYIDLGYLQQVQKQQEEADESYLIAIEAVAKTPGFAHQYSEKFSSYGLYKYALLCYETAERNNPNLIFHYQKALVYAELGDMENMYNSYLTMIEFSPNYYSTVKQNISRNITDDPANVANVVLKKQLIKKIQETENPLFSELLIWLYIEENAYSKALRQLQALDKRDKNYEREIYNLGEKALYQENFVVAQECFTYIKAKGFTSGFYTDAVFSSLETAKQALRATPGVKKSDFVNLLNNHYQALNDLAGEEEYVETKRNIASILYFDLNLKDSATHVLENTIATLGNTYKKPIAHCKMLLGDFKLADGESIDAIFKYMEVERAFSGTPLGDEAKFMKGMVAYYTLDFPWALNQFEVLKSSTTKLISNDALEMALLITDNSVEDTLYQGLSYYAQADLYNFRGMPDTALATLDLLLAVFPAHNIVAEATLFKARILYKQAKYTEAIATLDELLKNGNADIWVDDVLMLQGEIYQLHLGEREKAMLAYETVLFNHPGSIYVPEARRQYRKLRGDNLTN